MFTIPAPTKIQNAVTKLTAVTPYKHIITYTKVHGNDKNRGAVECNLRPLDS